MSNPSPFRPLNDAERSLISALVKRGKLPDNDDRYNYLYTLLVSYENMQGGFCVCILVFNTDSCLLYRGASRRSYKDSRNQLRGEMMAFRRAVLYSHPVIIT